MAGNASSSASPRSAQSTVEQGLLGRSLTNVAHCLLFAVVTLVFAVIIEWIGMTLFWPEQGVSHSAGMLERELGYLSRDFKHSVLVEQPLAFAERFAKTFHDYLFQKTGIERFLIWLGTPEPNQNQALHAWIRYAYRLVANYITAAMTMVEVFAVRLAVLVLSVPAFALLACIGVIDGLVQRDIRRWSGGRESAFLYHWAKKCIGLSLALPWVIYLAMPVSIHPNLIVLPFAVALALALHVLTATFKKYL